MRRSLGIKVPELSKSGARALARQVAANLKTLPAQLTKRLSTITSYAAAGGLRGEELVDEIEHALGLDRVKAKKLAVGQVIQINATLTRERHQALGITHYVWRSVPDQHTRNWHRNLNGKTFAYDDPPMGGGAGPKDHGHPGSSDRCRCQAIPVMPTAQELSEKGRKQAAERAHAATEQVATAKAKAATQAHREALRLAATLRASARANDAAKARAAAEVLARKSAAEAASIAARTQAVDLLDKRSVEAAADELAAKITGAPRERGRKDQ